MDRIRDIAPPPRSGFQTLLYNPGGRWSRVETGGGTEGQVHVEVEWLWIEAKLAELEARAETTELEPTRAERTDLEPTRAEQTGLEPTRAEQTFSTAEQKTTGPEQKTPTAEQRATRLEQKATSAEQIGRKTNTGTQTEQETMAETEI